MKRVVVISDLHCGHRAGLTPPSWQYKLNDSDYERSKFAEVQEAIWNFYTTEIEKLKPIDSLFVLGDCIEGKGEKSGGTELLEPDRLKQCEIASDCINFVDAKKIAIIRGTPYHVGKEEDFENIVAEKVKAETIGDHEWIDVNGLIFDLKHFRSGSAIPHGRHTSISRDKLWNILWAERKGQPRSDVLIRGHVHFFEFCGELRTLNLTMPALQGWGSKFGTKIPSGTIDIGFIYFDVENKHEWSWNPRILESEILTVDMLKF